MSGWSDSQSWNDNRGWDCNQGTWRERSRSPARQRRGKEASAAIDATICKQFLRGVCQYGDRCIKKHFTASDSERPYHGYVKSVDENRKYGFVACSATFQAYGRDVYVRGEELGDLSALQEVAFALATSDKQQLQATSLLAENNGTYRNASASAADTSGDGSSVSEKSTELKIGDEAQVSIKGAWFSGKVQSTDAAGKARILCDIDEMDLKRRNKTPPTSKEVVEAERDGQIYPGIIQACVKNIPFGYKIVALVDAKAAGARTAVEKAADF